jgi:hypothetical protein
MFGRITVETSISQWKVHNMNPGDEEDRYQRTTSFMLFPVWWLARLGASEGMHIVLSNSSTRGWKFNKTSLRPVPDDSPIFELCAKGDVGDVTALFQRGEATIWDSDSKGLTPLMVGVTIQFWNGLLSIGC